VAHKFEERQVLSFTNPNRAYVVAELDSLRDEWVTWQREAESWGDSEDFRPGETDVALKDGWENIRKHGVLREKTLTFIGNNFTGYGFLFEDWPRPPHEYNLGRRREAIPGWIHRLDKLAACIEYARAPDGYFKAKAKQLTDKMIEVGPERAVDFIAAALRNPSA
jgi:hypothetical protein